MDQNDDAPYFLIKLKEEYTRRNRRNSLYSMRAYALDLNINPATLSSVFRGKRGLAKKMASVVCQKLSLSERQKDVFMRSVHEPKSSLKGLLKHALENDKVLLEEDRFFKIIANWEYYAFLSLTEVDDFQMNSDWVACRLGISIERAEEVIDGLVESGLLSIGDGGEITVQSKNLMTTEDVFSQALQESHEESLHLGIDKLRAVPVDRREFRSFTIAMDEKIFPQVKNLIRDFFERLEAFTDHNKNKTDVFQFCFQAYPLTESRKEENSHVASC